MREFTGPVDRPRLRNLLRRAACAAVPALGGEALGLVLVEAAAAGVPVAASDIAGYRIAARDGAAAELVPPNNPSALAGALQRLLDDPARRAELAARGRAAARRFDARRIARRHLEIYEHLVESRL